MIERIWTETDNAIQVKSLADAVIGETIADATVTATVTDPAGNAVTGVGTITLAAVSGSAGDYAGQIPAAAELVAGTIYTIAITIIGNGYTTKYTLKRLAAQKKN